MVLNWNIEVIIDFIAFLVTFILALLTYTAPKTKGIKSLFFIRLGIIWFSLFMLTDGLSFLLISELIGRVSGLLVIPTTLSFAIGINYTIKETFNSVGIIFICGVGALFAYFATLPGIIVINTSAGYLRLSWVGIFDILGQILTAITTVYFIYWGLKTWLNAPFLIKKEAFIFFIGAFLIPLVGVVLYILDIFVQSLILVSTISITIGALIFMISIMNEPKLLYILPFTIHRIVVKDKDGHPLFDHDWSESNISESIFTGFLNAVQLMSEEVMHIGGLLHVNLERGILILKESERVSVGLVASKSSKLLNDSVVKFTEDFETKFNRELKSSIKDMHYYESAYELIEKYFSNFPYKIIKSKKQPLLLSGKFIKIPLELDNKLRNVFTDEKEYEAIKSELIKSPLSIPPDFINSYNEMKEELEQISNEDVKYLDDESNSEE
jgi:hypothetical protein